MLSRPGLHGLHAHLVGGLHRRLEGGHHHQLLVIELTTLSAAATLAAPAETPGSLIFGRNLIHKFKILLKSVIKTHDNNFVKELILRKK